MRRNDFKIIGELSFHELSSLFEASNEIENIKRQISAYELSVTASQQRTFP